MDREAFDRKYAARLNRQQQEAVHAVEGPVLLLAVPGSGKTTVLVTRLGYMLCCCGIAPDQILTMTYTRAAAGEMKQRFAALFGQDCPHPPEIRTINGVSSKIIAYYAQNCGKRPPFILAEDESALAKLVSDLYRDLCGEYPTQSVVKELRKSIAYAKNMMLPEERLGELDTGFEKSRSCTGNTARRCGTINGWTMTTRWCTPRKSWSSTRMCGPIFRTASPISAWTNPRTPPGSSTPSSACWPGKAATSSW